MNERNMETQIIALKMAFINLSIPLHRKTMSNSESPGTTMTKSNGTDRRVRKIALVLK